MKEFKNIYEMFSNVVNPNISWAEWMILPQDHKAIALYVRFYKEITLAWGKTKKPFMDEGVAISTLMQYLMKNTDIIAKNPRRYSGAYMYKLAFNAFYPLGRIKRDIEFYENSVGLYQFIPEKGEIDVYMDVDNICYSEIRYVERLVDNSDILNIILQKHRNKQIYKIIYSLGDKEQIAVERVINKLIQGKPMNKDHRIIALLQSLLKNVE